MFIEGESFKEAQPFHYGVVSTGVHKRGRHELPILSVDVFIVMSSDIVSPLTTSDANGFPERVIPCEETIPYSAYTFILPCLFDPLPLVLAKLLDDRKQLLLGQLNRKHSFHPPSYGVIDFVMEQAVRNRLSKTSLSVRDEPHSGGSKSIA